MAKAQSKEVAQEMVTLRNLSNGKTHQVPLATWEEKKNTKEFKGVFTLIRNRVPKVPPEVLEMEKRKKQKTEPKNETQPNENTAEGGEAAVPETTEE